MDRGLKVFVVTLLAIIVLGNLIRWASHTKGGEPSPTPAAVSEPEPIVTPAAVAHTTPAPPAIRRHSSTESAPTSPSASEGTNDQPQSSPQIHETKPTTPTSAYPYGYIPDNQASASDSGPPSPTVESAAQRVGRQLRGR